jgi:hypothetical protein
MGTPATTSIFAGDTTDLLIIKVILNPQLHIFRYFVINIPV